MFSALNVSRSSAPLLAHPALIRSRAKPTCAKAAMPRSSAADQIGSKSGWLIDRPTARLPSAAFPRPRTGASGIMNARLPASRIRSISASDQSMSWRSIWVTGMSRSAWPSTTSIAHRFQVDCTSWIRSKRPSRATWMIGPTRNVGLRNCTSIPRSSHHASRPVGPEPRVSVVGVVVGLALVGHLEVVHEARRDQIPSVVRLLGCRQLRERPVGDAEDVAGDLHEPRRLTHLGSQCRIRPRDPVQRLVQMSVDIDDAHLIPPLLAPNLPNGGGRASATSPPFVLAGVVGTTCPVERVELCHVLVGK